MLPSHLSSAHALVKALKAAKDPPIPDGPSKLDIARLAVAASDIYLPNKHRIISEWILDAWARSKVPTGTRHPILDPAYHQLLHSLSETPVIDIAPLLLIYISADDGSTRPRDWAAKSFRKLKSADRPRLEAWIEVWSALVKSLATSPCNVDEDLVDLILSEWTPDHSIDTMRKLALLLGPTLPTLAAASVAKRLDAARVLQLHFAWPSLHASDVFDSALRQLGRLDEAAACLVPHMFSAFIRTVNAHRYRVFSQPSSSKVGTDVYMAEKVRQTIRIAFDCLLRYLDSHEPASWAARSEAWNEVLRWGGYLEVDADWSKLVSNEKERAESALAASDASRPFILRAISILERLDHRAANLGPDVVGWCLAAPVQLREQARAVLIALADYHRLTHSFIPLVQLINEAYQLLLAACDSSQATRVVYSLLEGGILSDKSVRTALHGKGLPRRELDSIAEELLSQAEMPAKRRKTDKPSTLAAATTGIRSRLFSIILKGTNTASFVEPTPHAASSWAADVQLAARLRVWSASTPVQETRPVDREQAVAALANADTILEARLQLAYYLLSQPYDDLSEQDMEVFIRILAESGTAPQFWEMLRASRTIPLLSLYLTPRQKFALLSRCSDNEHLLAPECIETAGVMDAIDTFISQALADDDFHDARTLIPFASPENQAAAVDVAVRSDRLAVYAPWLCRVLLTNTDRRLVGIGTLLTVVHKAIKLQLFDVMNAAYEAGCRRHSDLAIEKFVDAAVVSSSRACGYMPAALLFDAVMVAYRRDNLQPATIDRLAAACAFIETAVEADVDRLLLRSRSELLTVWSAVQRMRTWLRSATLISIYDKILSQVNSTWSAKDIAQTVQIMRSQPGSNHVANVLRVMRLVSDNGSKPLREIIADAPAEELQSMLPAVLAGCATSDAYWRHLLWAILASTRNDSAGVVRAHSADIINALTGENRLGSFDMTLDSVQSLRLFVERNPFTLAPPDLTALIEWMLSGLRLPTLTQEVFSEIINLATILVRNRADSLVQQVAGLIDFCCAIPPLFVQRSRSATTALGPAAAALASRFYATLVDKKHSRSSDAFLQGLIKHFPAVLVAYSRAVADPRGRMRPEARRELMMGLWPICDVVTTGGRVQSRGREGEALGDAFGLGDGSGGEAEKEIWADLWSSWSRKRYTGQG